MRTFTGIHRRGDPSCEALDGRRGQDVSVVTASGPKTPKEGTRPTRLHSVSKTMSPRHSSLQVLPLEERERKNLQL